MGNVATVTELVPVTMMATPCEDVHRASANSPSRQRPNASVTSEYVIVDWTHVISNSVAFQTRYRCDNQSVQCSSVCQLPIHSMDRGGQRRIANESDADAGG